ncbi:hypothetical protein, partial [Brevibacillus choshinensis]|uniref:hypothetical protein n=1 Tax=Brevibacillus choshinensis TaxID=54911 RepID=UPI002E21A2EC|nr:hypothetical protein [Brevibacillus choshinensis]
TGYAARIEGLPLAGKTGTAELKQKKGSMTSVRVFCYDQFMTLIVFCNRMLGEFDFMITFHTGSLLL